MTHGVIYMTWGHTAMKEADRSMGTLWKYNPAMPVLVIGDAAAEAHYKASKKVIFKLIKTDPFDETRPQSQQFRAGRIKPLLYNLSPFDQSLYVDADSQFQSSPNFGFSLLDKWDFVVAETETRSLLNSIAGLQETHWTANWVGTPHLLYHNSGLLFWRKNKVVEKLFQLWSNEWLRFQGWDEQVALLRALLRSEAVFLTVPYTWNCREGTKTMLLHHWFGTKAVRAILPVVTAHKRITKPQALILTEISPGRFVKCIPGDEEETKRQLLRLRKIPARRAHASIK